MDLRLGIRCAGMHECSLSVFIKQALEVSCIRACRAAGGTERSDRYGHMFKPDRRMYLSSPISRYGHASISVLMEVVG